MIKSIVVGRKYIWLSYSLKETTHLEKLEFILLEFNNTKAIEKFYNI